MVNFQKSAIVITSKFVLKMPMSEMCLNTAKVTHLRCGTRKNPPRSAPDEKRLVP